jgi:hypothetical protein
MSGLSTASQMRQQAPVPGAQADDGKSAPPVAYPVGQADIVGMYVPLELAVHPLQSQHEPISSSA